MKKITLILGFVLCIGYSIRAQPITNDTVVCIIDTTKSYVAFKKNPFPERNPKPHWQIVIKGHYYDISQPHDKDIAAIVFDWDESVNNVYESVFNGPYQIKVSKVWLKHRYELISEEWINKQTNDWILQEKIGAFPAHKFNFIIFKQDFENPTNDVVVMYRVTVGYNEVVE